MRASTPVLGRILGLFSLVVLIGACGSQGGDSADTREATNQPSTTTTETATAGSISGDVLETMDSGGYTYVRLEHDGSEVWAAGPVTEVAVGDAVSVSTQMPMKGFRSETLDRSFDTLYFVNDFGGTAKESDPHAGMDMADMDEMTSGSGGMAAHGQTPKAGVAVGEITPAADGHTVGALYASSASLAGKTTTVRGRVVKFNGGIMGKNWVHLQDGTGDSAASTHDLLVTTSDRCKVGEVITATGTVSVDKDFGAGYKYDLLLEDASIEVEAGTTGR